MDPLSDVLSLLKPRSYMVRGFDVAAPWAVRFGRHVDGIKFYAITAGQGWLRVEGVAEPVAIAAGDCFLLPTGRPFSLASGLDAPILDGEAIDWGGGNGGVAVLGGGGDCFGIGGYFTFDSGHAGLLLEVLPPIVHIAKEADKAALRASLQQMMLELREPRPGGFLMAQHLAHMMLVQALRLYLAEGSNGAVGWLFALADRQMSTAIGAMHADPARRWTLQALAEVAGMSRSSFAVKFKQTVGSSPMDYLTRWRMLLAGERLSQASEPVSAIALSLGYESESAFSTAFKRVMGCSPRQHGRGRTPLRQAA